jgi:hypothetical protein
MTEEIEGWAIVQAAPSTSRLKEDKVFLALVDRTKDQTLWWTADDPELVMQFHKKHAAEHSANRLKKAVVVTYDQALGYITEQHKKFSGAEQ